jgi:hypothetical protein
MRPDDIRRWLVAEPFLPFRLHVLETTAYEVRHPEAAMLARSTVRIEVPNLSAPVPVELSFVVIALLHITRIEPILRQGSPSGNGATGT